MKKALVLALFILLAAAGTYIIFTADQARGGMMGGAGMMGGGMMGGNMNGGNNTVNNQVTEWEAPPAQAVRKNPVPAGSESIDVGREIFASECAYCHGTNGRGTSIAPDLGSNDVKRQTDGALFWKITNGNSPMPSFANRLTEYQRWDVINFIRTLYPQPGQYASAPTQTAPVPSGTTVSPVTTLTRLMVMDSIAAMMSGTSMVAAPDGTISVMMGNELLKYDNNLNLLEQVEIKFDWENWQKTMMVMMQEQTN